MNMHPKQLWHRSVSSLWFVPMCSVVAALIASEAIVWIDKAYFSELFDSAPWLFVGTPAAAADILSTVAASMITVVSISFSMTLIAVQQAASQYSPRVVNTVTSDRGNQIVLGSYLGTFVYSLNVLRSIRYAQDGSIDQFVPAMAIFGSFLLAVTCLLMLIWFIHNVSVSLKVSRIIERLHEKLIGEIDRVYPSRFGEEADAEQIRDAGFESMAYIVARSAGYIAGIEDEEFHELPDDTRGVVKLTKRIGEFVAKGEVLGCVYDSEDSDVITDAVENAISIDDDRSLNQDIMFPLEQITDVAVRALSPGINDPFTANECINYLSDALKQLAHREFPKQTRSFKDGNLIVITKRIEWEEMIEKTLRFIQRHGTNFASVQQCLRAACDRILEGNTHENRASIVKRLRQDIEEAIIHAKR